MTDSFHSEPVQRDNVFIALNVVFCAWTPYMTYCLAWLPLSKLSDYHSIQFIQGQQASLHCPCPNCTYAHILNFIMGPGTALMFSQTWGLFFQFYFLSGNECTCIDIAQTLSIEGKIK